MFLIVEALECTYGCRGCWLESMWWHIEAETWKKKTIIQSIIKILVCCCAAESVYVSTQTTTLKWLFPSPCCSPLLFCFPSHKASGGKKKKSRQFPIQTWHHYSEISLFWWNPQPEKFYLLESNCQASILHVVAEDAVSECSHQTFSFNILCK